MKDWIVMAGLVVPLSAGCELLTSCFPAGTRVRTPHGDRAIEEIAVGDAVIACDPTTLRLSARRVVALPRGRATRLYTIELTDHVVESTSEHPFWDAESHRWVEARHVRPGMVLVAVEQGVGGSVRPERVRRVGERIVDEPVFNLTVDGEHTFFAEGILVHNKSEPSEPVTCTEQNIPAGQLLNCADRPVAISSVRVPEGWTVTPARFGSKEPLADAWAKIPVPPSSTVDHEKGHSFGFPSSASTPSGQPGPLILLEIDGRRWIVSEGTGALVDATGNVVPGRRSATGDVLPIEDASTPKTCARVSTPFSIVATPSFDRIESGTIKTLEWNTDKSCVEAGLSSDRVSATLRACLTAALWPFSVGDIVSLEVKTGLYTVIADSTRKLVVTHLEGRADEVFTRDRATLTRAREGSPGGLPFRDRAQGCREVTACGEERRLDGAIHFSALTARGTVEATVPQGEPTVVSNTAEGSLVVAVGSTEESLTRIPACGAESSAAFAADVAWLDVRR